MALRTDNLVIPQGTTWEIHWPIIDETGAPAPLDGWEARAQARSSVAAAVPLHEWTLANGGALIVDSAVVLKLRPEQSAAFAFVNAVYDIELFHTDGRVVRVTQGSIKIDREVTR